MATEATLQVIPSSIDEHGMSVVTASRDQKAPRSGIIYDPATLAAAQPIWFHPMSDGRYLALFSRRLTNATLSPVTINGVLLYSDYSLSTAPCWAPIGLKTGQIDKVTLIPSELPGPRTLVAAASRGEYLFTLSTYKTSADADTTQALLQNFRVTPYTGITLLGEEFVPGDLSLGLFVDIRYLWVFGASPTGKLTVGRKNWGRIGLNPDASPTPDWLFWGSGSWNSSRDQMAGIVDEKGVELPADGPCSMARYRDTYYLMATSKTTQPATLNSGDARLALAVSPDGKKAYVADYKANKVKIIDVTDPAKPTAVGSFTTRNGPWALTFHADKLYVMNRTTNSITVHDPAKEYKIVAEILVGKTSSDMVFHPTQSALYVAQSDTNTISIIDTDKNKAVSSITVGEKPFGIVLNSSGSRLYVTNQRSKTVSVINTTTNKVIKNIPLGGQDSPTIITRKDDNLYVGGTDRVLGISTTTNRVFDLSPIPNIGLTLLAGSEKIYLANTADTISVLDPATIENPVTTVSQTFCTGTDLGAVQISLNNGKLYATNAQDNTLIIINPATGATLGSVSLSDTVPVTVQSLLAAIVARINALLGGIVNGFIRTTSGVVSSLSDLFSQAAFIITGQAGTVTEVVTGLVGEFINAITGAVQQVSDPATLLQNIFQAITGSSVSQAVETAQSYLQGTINTILGLGNDLVTLNPVKFLEDLIRAITGILTGTGNTGSPGVASLGTSQAALAPEASWKSTTYVSRKVEQSWKPHGFTYPIAPSTSTYQNGGSYLQPQIPLTPGYGIIPTTSGVSYLDEFSDHVQVLTGTGPHTLILPPTAKVVGTTITTEGAIQVPDAPISFAPTLSIEDATVKEGNLGNVTVVFRVTLSSSTSDEVTVSYTTGTQAGTASAGQDFVAASGTLTFAPGIVSQQITVTVRSDFHYEPDETFYVTLSDSVNADIDDDTAMCTIVNDDRQTLIDSLLEEFKNIVNGITSGAIKTGTFIASTVATLLEQATRTLTGVVGDTGNLVLGAVDQFLNLISGGLVDLPGDYGTPAENLANILNLITGGSANIVGTITTLADTLYTTITSPVDALISQVTNGFQNLINALFGLGSPQLAGAPLALSFAAPALLSSTSTDPVAYMPYTIHNQSTADIAVMASGRDKAIAVPHGSGYTFTPYTPEPTQSQNWSWAFATDRAPRTRQGFPFVTTSRVNVNTYQITISGSPTSGKFRLIHDGHVSEPITLSTSSATTADNIRRAIASFKTVKNFNVTAQSASQFTVVITEDYAVLNYYSYRLFNGTNPKVEVSLQNSTSTLVTKWSIFQPDPKPAQKSGVAPTATTVDTALLPTGLTEIIALFTKVITAVSGGAVALGTGVVDTVTGLIGDAVYLITGQEITDTDGKIKGQVTDFLQKLAITDGVSADAGAAFESVLRQITGGTGLTGTSAVPAPLDFVTTAVGALEDAIENLAEQLQKILAAITGN